MTIDEAVRAACRSVVDAASRTVLATRITSGGRYPSMLAGGYVPLLVDATEEDREAKGLRKLDAGQAPRIAVHDTLLEAADRERLLLLGGPAGSGKHTFLMHLAAHLAGATIGDAMWTKDGLARAVPRNDAGTVIVERWTGALPVPLFLDPDDSLAAALERHDGVGHRVRDGSLAALLLVDGAERLGGRGTDWLAEAAELVAHRPLVRVLVSGDADVLASWRIPGGFVRRRVIPMFDAQRAALRVLLRPDASSLVPVDPDVAGSIALYALALENGVVDEPAVAIVDRWLADTARREAVDVDALVERSSAVDPRSGAARLDRPFLAAHLAARRLRPLSMEAIGALHRADPARWSGVVRTFARRLVVEGRPVDALVATLIGGDGEAAARGVVTALRIASDLPSDGLALATRQALDTALVPIVVQGRLPVALRDEAGRALAIAGDPRDLDALVPIAAGPFTMGSTAHSNSVPRHVVTLGAYRIGRYPVTNERFGRFVVATGRAWRSKDGWLPERANSPAVDLTWHDARAYCDWLTDRWRAEARIAIDDVVRLPTEPEWERAARGLQSADGLVYPWSGPWHDDRANSAEAGLNQTCAVGLFPSGRSTDGCDDMAGQVWEWTTTLWGEDMATPRFTYPWAADGREDPDGPADVRRVLRGGCFLSPREKANCIYRGSLEPDGYWRGNGFRIVVVPG